MTITVNKHCTVKLEFPVWLPQVLFFTRMCYLPGLICLNYLFNLKTILVVLREDIFTYYTTFSNKYYIEKWKRNCKLYSDFLGHTPEPYCDHALSRVCPSLDFTFWTSSPQPLDGFWWNLVGMKYSWSCRSVVVFRPDPSRGGSRAGKIGHGGYPPLRNFFFRPDSHSDKLNAQKWS